MLNRWVFLFCECDQCTSGNQHQKKRRHSRNQGSRREECEKNGIAEDHGDRCQQDASIGGPGEIVSLLNAFRQCRDGNRAVDQSSEESGQLHGRGSENLEEDVIGEPDRRNQKHCHHADRGSMMCQ